LVLVGDLFHLRLELGEILGGQLVLKIDVVVEAGVRRRADVELGIRKDAQQGRRQHVRARVPKFVERSHRHDGKR
jgi:hypothetical protein